MGGDEDRCKSLSRKLKEDEMTKIDWTIEEVDRFVDRVLRASKQYVEKTITLEVFATAVLDARSRLMDD